MTGRLTKLWCAFAFWLFQRAPHDSWLWWRLLPWAGLYAHHPDWNAPAALQPQGQDHE